MVQICSNCRHVAATSQKLPLQTFYLWDWAAQPYVQLQSVASQCSSVGMANVNRNPKKNLNKSRTIEATHFKAESTHQRKKNQNMEKVGFWSSANLPKCRAGPWFWDSWRRKRNRRHPGMPVMSFRLISAKRLINSISQESSWSISQSPQFCCEQLMISETWKYLKYQWIQKKNLHTEHFQIPKASSASPGAKRWRVDIQTHNVGFFCVVFVFVFNKTIKKLWLEKHLFYKLNSIEACSRPFSWTKSLSTQSEFHFSHPDTRQPFSHIWYSTIVLSWCYANLKVLEDSSPPIQLIVPLIWLVPKSMALKSKGWQASNILLKTPMRSYEVVLASPPMFCWSHFNLSKPGCQMGMKGGRWSYHPRQGKTMITCLNLDPNKLG